jgi:hypothetical protein
MEMKRCPANALADSWIEEKKIWGRVQRNGCLQEKLGREKIGPSAGGKALK